MSPEAWTFFTVNTAGILTLIGDQVRTRRKLDRKLDKAASSAASAAERSLPTSNGFAAKVTSSLDRLEAGQADTTRRLGRVEDRLDAHLDRGDH